MSNKEGSAYCATCECFFQVDDAALSAGELWLAHKATSKHRENAGRYQVTNLEPDFMLQGKAFPNVTVAAPSSTPNIASSSAPDVEHNEIVPTPKTRRPVLYLSGPMHGSKARPDDREECSETARRYAKRLWGYGYAVFSPHGNTDFMFGSGLYSAPFLELDLAFIEKLADGIFMMHGWQGADGCLAEKLEAEKKGLPLFYTLQEAHDWITSSR